MSPRPTAHGNSPGKAPGARPGTSRGSSHGSSRGTGRSGGSLIPAGLRGVSAAGRAADTAQDAARNVAESRPMNWAARAGLAARAVVYLLIGVLALLLAGGSGGSGGSAADQKGALSAVASHSYGTALVLLVAIGLAGYALWRLSEAAFGVTGEPPGAGPRLKSAARGVTYLVLTGTAISVLQGSRGSTAGQQQDVTAKLLGAPGGRALVALVGLVVVGVAVGLAMQGWRATFLRYFAGVPHGLYGAVRILGRVGTIARAVVFALIGLLFLKAAWTFDPQQATGIDGALHVLLRQPFGQVLAGLAAVGLIAFGVFGLAEARYRRV